MITWCCCGILLRDNFKELGEFIEKDYILWYPKEGGVYRLMKGI